MRPYQKLKEAALLLDPEFYPGGIVPAEAIEKHSKCLEIVKKIRASRDKWAAANQEKRNAQARARSAAKRQAA